MLGCVPLNMWTFGNGYIMKNVLILIIFLWLAFPSLLLAQGGGQAAPGPSNPGESALTFGSQMVLEGCWSEAELQGAPAEKKSLPGKPSSGKTPSLPVVSPIALPPLPPTCTIPSDR